ncbi:Dot5p [Sugiyamaella lignohabitans]|uniref:thioredoxin-dependent peroxiredoxin n=1 Tax=Sugiyamaella lignohabitans TaxID=796027 RepID=A0A167DIE3_9ASCO|nr:Dot5p [Sugiyamaella lignohabitans]ANB12951.1 Dot5p [Sugiyamaella lignohabitans]
MTEAVPVRRSARVAAAAKRNPELEAKQPEVVAKKAKPSPKSKAKDTLKTEKEDVTSKDEEEHKQEAAQSEDKPAVAKDETESEKVEAKPVKSKQVEVGDAVPDITLLDQDSKEVNLAEVAKSSPFVVIFAYPKANTPGCTRQACAYRDHHEEFKSADVRVFGLSADSPSAQKKFETKFDFPYQLLSDPKYELIGVLGAKKTATGGVTRSHWVIKDGKFVSVNVGVKPDDSWSKTLDLVKNSA